MKKLLFTLFAILFIKQSFYAQTTINTDSISAEIQSLYNRGHIVGFGVAIVNGKGTIYERGFGFSDVSKNKNYTSETLQNIASISKTFIGIALLKAQELGHLKLDDPINKYLPFNVTHPTNKNSPITIRHLATHTSSIKDPGRYEKSGYVLLNKDNQGLKVPSNFESPDKMFTQAAFLEHLLSEDGVWYKKSNFLKDAPGATFEYSNVAASLAALVLEGATKTPFNEFTKKHIFQPLEMNDTGWFFEEIDVNKHTKLYENPTIELAMYQLCTYADGGLKSSANNMAKYLSELIAGYNDNGKILSKDSYHQLYTGVLKDAQHKDREQDKYDDEYDMGVFMGLSAQGQIGHTGGDPGVATFMFFDTHKKLGKLLFINTNLSNEGVQEFMDVWRVLEKYTEQ